MTPWRFWTAAGPSGSPRIDRRRTIFRRPPRAFSCRTSDRRCGSPPIGFLAHLNDPRFKLVDARNADRYRGENETIDPVAGHIPGAINAPYADNLNPDGTFKSADQLRARFESVLGDTPADQTAFYCGSGITAAHNLIALEYAGLGESKLYAGSWSEWITDESRPISTGSE